MIWFLKLAVLLSGKYLARNALVSSSHVVTECIGNEWSHALALSVSANGNIWRRMASEETLFIFKVLHTFKKIKRWKLGSSISKPPNWDCLTMETSAILNSKFLVLTTNLAMLDEMPWMPRVNKSHSVLLWSFPPSAIIGEALRALCLCFSSLCLFCLKWRVLSISGSDSYGNGLRIKREKSPASSNTNTTNAIKRGKKSKKKCLVTFVSLTR